MFTLQLPSGIPATWLVPMLGMALLSLVTCGSGLLWMRWHRRGSLPLVHAILVVSLLMPLAAPLAWAGVWSLGWSPIRLVAIAPEPAPTPPPAAMLENRSPMPAPPQLAQWETPGLERDATAPADRSAPAAPPIPATTSLPIEDEIGLAGAQVAQPHAGWRGIRGIEPGIAAIWLLGTVYQLAWLGWGLLRVRRFERTVQAETDPELLSVARSVAEQFAMPTCPAVGRSTATDTPLSLGLWRPRIILPAESGESRWAAESWRPLLVHELAHIHRKDHLVGLMQRLALAIYWWNPLAWAASRELSLVRELICDDVATSGMATSNMSSGEPSASRQYAEILINLADRVADRAGGQPDYVSALAAWSGPRDDLSRRIHRLLDPSRRVVTTLSRKATIACGGFSLVMLLLVLAVGVRIDRVAAKPPAEVPPTEKATEIAAQGDGDEDAVELLEKTILVVDQDGQPIEGAQVTPSGLSLQGGSSMGWTNGQKAMTPEPLVTDDQGVTVIRYPKYGLKDMQSMTRGLFCHFNHPDFAAKMSELIYLSPDNPAQVTTVRLSRGAQVELVPRLNGELVTGGKLFADWNSRAYAPHLMATLAPSGHLQLPRLNPGTEIVRVAYISEAGERYFSRAERLELKEGETMSVEVALEPAVVIRGKLDDRVPRPVTGGRVVAVVAERGESMFALVWQSYAEVDQQGNFTLEPMPPGTLQVIALCDGYMAKADDPPAGTTEAELWTKLSGRPQTFELDDELTEITVAMTPTATAVVRLLSPQGEPVPKTRISFNPNVFWKHGYAQIYCCPLTSSWKAMLDPTSIREQPFDASTLPFSAETDAEGMAVVANLPPGPQSFGFAHDQFQLAERRENPLHNDASIELVAGAENEFTFTLQAKLDPATRELIPATQETIYCGPGVSQLVKPRPEKTFVTQAAETELAGVVVDADGKPLAGVEVDVWTWHPGNEATTDEQGRFRLTGLDRLSEVEVEFSKPGYCPSLYPAQKTGTQNWTIVLTDNTYREGQVLSPDGQPVPGALVRVARGPFQNSQVLISQVWTEATTDDEGRYRLYLEPYDYEIQVRVPNVGSYRQQDLKVTRGSTERLDLKLEKGLTFKAKIINSETGEPVEGIQLWNWQHAGIEGTSNADGLIEIDGMSPGEFEFMVTAVGTDRRRSSIAGKYARWWSPAAVHEHERKEPGIAGQFTRNLDDLTFDIQPGGTPVEIFVEPMVTITGQVLDPEGNSVEGATVAPAKTGSGNSLTGDTRYSYPTDAAGRFTMHLPASLHVKYNLIVHDGEYNQWRKWASGVTEPFQTKPGQVIEGMKLSLTHGATVRGKAVDVLGRPKPHAQVRAIGTDGLDNRYYVPSTKTDEQGNYELKFIRAGEQRIQAGPFWLDADQAPGKSTRTLTLASGEEVGGIDLVSQ